MNGDHQAAAAGEPAGTNPGVLHVRMTSDPAEVKPVRLAVERWVLSLGWDDTEAGEVGLCVNEALANVIEHAYGFAAGKPIELWARALSGAETPGVETPAVEIRIRDWGSGVDPTTLPPRPRDPTEPGGLGLICLREMMDALEYAPQPGGGVLLTMVRRRRHGGRPPAGGGSGG